MAATWKQSITTSAGIALMNKAYGVSSIIPTKAVTITDDISGLSVTQVMALTSVNYNQSRVPIVISNQANTTRIGIDIDNKDVNEQYDYYGIGVYFKQVNTGEEVLFSVIPLSGAATIIPNQSGVATSSISIDSYTSIVPGTNVELTVSDSGSVTRGDVEQIVAANQSFSFPKKPLATGIDLQSIKSIGIYQVNDDKTVVNAPDGFSGNGYLIVVGDGTTANPIVQEITDTATGNKSINVYNSSLNKWDGWQQFSYKSYVDDSIKSANEYTDNGLATKADDSKVVHTADMRKPASDVVGLEDVPQAVVKSGLTSGVDLNTVVTPGVYPFSAVSFTNYNDNGTYWGYLVVTSEGAIVTQTAYTTGPAQPLYRMMSGYPASWSTWVRMANDYSVAHIYGANNFDTTPTVNNNPLLLASSLPSDLARTSQQTNFTAGLKSGGIDVASKNDVFAYTLETDESKAMANSLKDNNLHYLEE